MLLQQITDFFIELMQSYNFGNSNEFKFQVGPQYNFSEKIVKKVLITQYLTTESVLYAIRKKCNLIICRYGFRFQFPVYIDEYTQKTMFLLFQNRIMVCIIPPAWDLVPNGPIDYLAHVLNVEFLTHITGLDSNVLGIAYKYSESESFSSIVTRIQRNLTLESVLVEDKKNTQIKSLFIPLPDSHPTDIFSHANWTDCLITYSISPSLFHYIQNSPLSSIYIPFSSILEPSLHKFQNTLALEFPRIEFEFFPTTEFFAF